MGDDFRMGAESCRRISMSRGELYFLGLLGLFLFLCLFIISIGKKCLILSVKRIEC